MLWKGADDLEKSLLLVTDTTQSSEVSSGELSVVIAVWIGGQEQVKQVTFVRCAI